MRNRISEESTNAGYSIIEILSGSGDLGPKVVDAIKEIRIFHRLRIRLWSKLDLLKNFGHSHVGQLIVPLRDEEEYCYARRLRPRLV